MRGFSLIETLIAMIVITIIALVAFEFFVYAQRFIIDAELRLMAGNFARETLEEQYMLPDHVLAPTADAVDNPLPAGAMASALPGTQSRTYSVNNTDSQNNALFGYEKVQVVVGWDY